MTTSHRILVRSSRDLHPLDDESVALVVTSPPYPMIEMWDTAFASQNDEVGARLAAGEGPEAFASMHSLLDRVWAECHRVLVPGGFLCVNIGDATRTVTGFRLYTNHARVTSSCEAMGFESLPAIIWRKPTNAPTKFMGSGMLPAGAYVTLEHEYVLIFRKGARRRFDGDVRELRRASAYFWEERNTWFSDAWDLRGTRQAFDAGTARARSAAFPFELAYRLVCMYSVYGDTVLDPFAGTGTTLNAALTAGRNSVGVEIDGGLAETIRASLLDSLAAAWTRQRRRFADHLEFVRASESDSLRTLRYTNRVHGFPVMTRQEMDLCILDVERVDVQTPDCVVAEHGTLSATG